MKTASILLTSTVNLSSFLYSSSARKPRSLESRKWYSSSLADPAAICKKRWNSALLRLPHPLCDIGRDRSRTSADLANEAIDFLLRKSSCTAITGQSKCMCLPPNHQVSKTLHVHLRRISNGAEP